MNDHECMIQLQMHADALQMQAPVITVMWISVCMFAASMKRSIECGATP